jgi:hypothetical protein
VPVAQPGGGPPAQQAQALVKPRRPRVAPRRALSAPAIGDIE